MTAKRWRQATEIGSVDVTIATHDSTPRLRKTPSFAAPENHRFSVTRKRDTFAHPRKSPISPGPPSSFAPSSRSLLSRPLPREEARSSLLVTNHRVRHIRKISDFSGHQDARPGVRARPATQIRLAVYCGNSSCRNRWQTKQTLQIQHSSNSWLLKHKKSRLPTSSLLATIQHRVPREDARDAVCRWFPRSNPYRPLRPTEPPLQAHLPCTCSSARRRP